MPIDGSDTQALAEKILSAAETQTPIFPVTDSRPDFGLADAYRISAAITRRRIAGGDRLVGWKIGFTNRSVWPSLGVDAPIWGPMYDATVSEMKPGGAASFSLRGLINPRIEPEIGLRIARVPSPDMDDDAILACVDAVTHGYEIVQSVYPEWRFKAPDGIATGGLHARYPHGPLVPIEPSERPRWARMLKELSIAIFRDGVEMDRGVGTAVLDGPISALGHLVRNTAKFPGHALKPGDLITTGTITKAFPVAAGERWSTEVQGIPLPGMDVAFV